MSRMPRGTTYRCPVCGSEIAVMARRHGAFDPVCCGVSMQPQARRLIFFVCPVCHSEIAVLHEGGGTLHARCCNVDMRREAA